MRAADLKREMVAALPRLRRFARTLAPTADAADDLVQEACARAIENAGRMRAGAPLDRWLFRVIRNLAIDEGRRAGTRLGRGTVEAAEAVAPALTDRAHGEGHVAAGELRDAVLGLPDGMAAALLLVSVEGYTYREAADILGVPPGTVMSRVSRGRRIVADARADARAEADRDAPAGRAASGGDGRRKRMRPQREGR